jgi:mRNA-degrading endonuclease YafQ of YafQ-DinJ toxin-antitoxin module
MTKYKVAYTNVFKRQRKALIARGYDISLLDDTIKMLANGEALPERYRDYRLSLSSSSIRALKSSRWSTSFVKPLT